jgi:HAMP domain-containing protein
MVRSFITNRSIITRQILVSFLIIVLTGGIVIVNILLFFGIEDSLRGMIDKNVSQIIENTELRREVSDVFTKVNLIINTFTERNKTLESDKNHLLETLQTTISALNQERTELKDFFQNYMLRLQSLLNQCIKLNIVLDDIRIGEKELNSQLSNLDSILAEKQLDFALKKTKADAEEADAIKQLANILTENREILLEVTIQIIRSKQEYFGTETVWDTHSQKIFLLLDEFSTGIGATTIAWDEIRPSVRSIKKTILQYNENIAVYFSDTKEFQTRYRVLQKSQEQIPILIEKMNKRIAGKAHTIRAGTSHRILTSLRTIVFISGIIITILIAMGIYTIRMIQPIKHLANITEELSEHGLDKTSIDKIRSLATKFRTESKNEIGQLAISFNRMADDLQKSTVSKSYVDDILQSMMDTLIVINPDTTIQTVNQAMLNLLGSNNLNSCFFWQKKTEILKSKVWR